MLGNFLPPTCKKDIFDQLIFLNSHNKLDFYSNKPFFLSHPKICQTNLTWLISNVNHERMHKLIVHLIRNYWKHLPRTETSQKFFSKTFSYNKCKSVKDYQKLSINFHLQNTFTLQYIE